MSSNDTNNSPVDVRGPRFAAWVTTAVLIGVLVLFAFSPVAATVLLAGQAVVFAVGALVGPRRHPYGVLFAKLVAPRLSPVTEREPVEPLRFAQFVGLIFAVVGLAGLLVAPVVGLAAAALALTAAFLNAAFGICLGCQLYPLAVQLRPTRA
ncbi:DUF4395 domain-containing protein [[Mycobacterium] zoologicum]|uniref:DUF4395 domain-containing protein n=1 Tax=[Mycobacterium] zoologicum TaxID=2872311 RepID=UPI001CDB441B|nr:DUF4395 domain-containing protein [Mycolicibacter sp. MYC101]MEB3061792.1 DUF4395 domain-containing protein [Mycolicibacter sp. MYC101]